MEQRVIKAANALRCMEKEANARLERWRVRFGENPDAEMARSDDALECAAAVPVFCMIAEALEGLPENPTNSYDKIRAYVIRELIDRAASPCRSTSHTRNESARYALSAYGHAARLLAELA